MTAGARVTDRVDESTTEQPRVEVRRSARRRRTVSAHREGDLTVVLIPASMSRTEERRWVDVMVRRLDQRDARRRPDDEALQARADALSRRYLDGSARPTSVRWVTNQQSRWGSCTPTDGSVRLSIRLQGMPPWVVDYVLVHELVHLLVPEHSAEFWSLVGRYPRAERARGFLDGVAVTARLGWPGGDVDGDGDDPIGGDDERDDRYDGAVVVVEGSELADAEVTRDADLTGEVGAAGDAHGDVPASDPISRARGSRAEPPGVVGLW